MATVAEALGIILDRLEAGREAEAEEISLRVLAAAPDEPDVLHVAGVVAARSGRFADAFSRLSGAARRRPDRFDIVTHFVAAAEMMGAPRADAARVLACLDPGAPAPYQSLLRFESEAIIALRALVRLDPGRIEYRARLGLTLMRSGRLTEALECARDAARLDPASIPARRVLSLSLFESGRAGEATRQAERAFVLDPGDAAGGLDLAGARADRDPENARRWARRALGFRADDAGAWNLLGIALGDLGREGEAADALRRAATLEPARGDVTTNLAQSLNAAGRAVSAFRLAARAARLRPGHVPALVVAARASLAAGRAERASRLVRLVSTLDPAPSAALWGDLLLTLQNDADAETTRNAHRRWGLVHVPPARPLVRPAPRSNARLRIGFISADFREHSVASFFEPLLNAFDRAAVFVVLYSATRTEDGTTARLRAAADAWRDVRKLDDEGAANLVRRDEVDVLVDLGGHTADNRLGVLARRPAPVQVSMLGYPGTVGSPSIDFRLTDPLIEPEGSEAWSVEPIVRLSGGFLRWSPVAAAPDPATDRPAGPPVFASFNTLGKMTERVMETWARALGAVPGSKLLLKSKALADAETAADLTRRFAALGVAPARLELVGWVRDRAAHMALYDRVDAALDPFPYNGTTTTCEALWMGVPVVTLAGDRHAARVGLSLLTRVGRPEWIARDLDAYVEIAAETVRRADRSDRPRLRAAMRNGPLGDVRGLAGEMETVFRRARAAQ